MVVTTSGPGRSGRTKPAAPTHQGYVDAIPLPAMLLDQAGKIVAINDHWRRQARPGGLVAPTDTIGKDHLHDLRDEKGFSRHDGRAMADAIEDVLQGRRQQAQHAYNLETEMGKRHWEGIASALHLDEGEFVLLIHQDRTAEDRSAVMAGRVGELMMAQEKAIAVARDRQRLIESAEQSFHAPLTPIRLQLHLLMRGNLGEIDERQAKALATIERNVERWWRLQSELMEELRMLEAGDHAPDRIDPKALLEEALQPFRERALKAGIRLRIDTSDADMVIKADPRAMVQILMLVLDNAIRQSPSGGLVWVRLRRVEREVELVIQDQDPVMDPDAAEALLAPDVEADNALRSGLLHASKTMARDGGHVEARCAGAGRGLEVILSWPIYR